MKTIAAITLSMTFAALSANADTAVLGRFKKVSVLKVVRAAVVDGLAEKDGSHAVVRVSVDLAVEANLGLCKFEKFSSTLDSRWHATIPRTYLEIVTTACPGPKSLDLVSDAYTLPSRSRTITATYEHDLYAGQSRTVTVVTGYKRENKTDIKTSFINGKLELLVNGASE